MRLSLIDYGSGVSGLESLLKPLSEVFSIDYSDEVLIINKKPRKLFSNYTKWLMSVDSLISDGIIGIALMPYNPSEKELGLNGLLFHSLFPRPGINSHNKLVTLNTHILNTNERLLKVAIHEVFELLIGYHYTHDEMGLPCANNGTLHDYPTSYQSIINARYYIDSTSPVLCSDCRELIREYN